MTDIGLECWMEAASCTQDAVRELCIHRLFGIRIRGASVVGPAHFDPFAVLRSIWAAVNPANHRLKQLRSHRMFSQDFALFVRPEQMLSIQVNGERHVSGDRAIT